MIPWITSSLVRKGKVEIYPTTNYLLKLIDRSRLTFSFASNISFDPSTPSRFQNRVSPNLISYFGKWHLPTPDNNINHTIHSLGNLNIYDIFSLFFVFTLVEQFHFRSSLLILFLLYAFKNKNFKKKKKLLCAYTNCHGFCI